MTFRLVLQPLVAAIFGIRAGIQDARIARPPYFWTILTSPADRTQLLQEGWKDVAMVLAVAVFIDVVYQLIVFRRVDPFEVILVSFLLACVPYVLIRGPANRIARTGRQHGGQRRRA